MDKKLATGQFDAITVIHNETSTGAKSPIYEIAQLKKKYPDVMFIVDSVSSIYRLQNSNFDAMGIDVLPAGSQKALALLGLTIFVVSKAALQKLCNNERPRILF